MTCKPEMDWEGFTRNPRWEGDVSEADVDLYMLPAGTTFVEIDGEPDDDEVMPLQITCYESVNGPMLGTVDIRAMTNSCFEWAKDKLEDGP